MHPAATRSCGGSYVNHVTCVSGLICGVGVVFETPRWSCFEFTEVSNVSVQSRVFIGCLLIASAFAYAAVETKAARDLTTPPRAESHYQLLVLEVPGCLYCDLFRRDVVPTYAASLRAKSVPMRFVDLEHGSLAAFDLQGPIETVPTIVLLDGRREVGRLTGHVGPEIFFHAVDRLISSAP